MKTHVMGRIITKYYKVDSERDDKGKFRYRPEAIVDDVKEEYEEIALYEGAVQTSGWGSVWLSEDEKVLVEVSKFRVDLGDWFQYTNKLIRTVDVDKEECKAEAEKLLREYNKQKIEDDSEAKAYCDLHKLDYEETDYDELLKVLGRNTISDFKLTDSFGTEIKLDPTGIRVNGNHCIFNPVINPFE